MFGFDWDNDGKEDLFDDDNYDIIGRPSGSCLVTVIMMGAAFILPLLGMLKFCV